MLNILFAAICARAMNVLSEAAVASGAILTVVDPGIELRLTSTLFAPLRRTAATAFILPDSTAGSHALRACCGLRQRGGGRR